jgi:hypothetical protein
MTGCFGSNNIMGISCSVRCGGQNRSQVKVIQQHLLCRKCVCGQRVWLTCVVDYSTTIAITLIYMDNMFIQGVWRRRRDSNPRDPSGPTPLAGERLRPLGHVSADGNSAEGGGDTSVNLLWY